MAKPSYEEFFKDYIISDEEWAKYSDRDKAFFGNQKPLRKPKNTEEYKDLFLKTSCRAVEEYKKAGFKSVIVQAYYDDEKTCSECKKQHGKVIAIDDAIIGKNIPPFKFCKNDWCRCSLQVVIPDQPD